MDANQAVTLVVTTIAMTIAAITIVAIAATAVVKNAAGGNSGKTKIAATNVINVMIAVINQ